VKLYIQADIEGIAGMAYWEDREDKSPENLHRRLRLRRIMTAELNAAALGAFDGGAEAVTIWDSHGAGDSIIVEELDKRVELITGNYHRAPWLPFWEDGYDAGMYLCAHAMAGTPFACLPHTRVVLNGKAYGEAGMFIVQLAAAGKPTLMVSGDRAAVDEALALVPDMASVVSKKALGPYLVKTRTPESVCEEMRAMARNAVHAWRDMPVYDISPPYVFTYEKDGAERQYVGRSEDLVDVYRRFVNVVYGLEGGNQCTGREWLDRYLPDEYKERLT
jgi:D-amino peptidase